MFENRSLRLDLFALFLLALVLFLAVSLTSYDPADPVAQFIRPLAKVYSPDVVVYPPNERVNNACGRWGSLAADLMLNAFGLGAYYLLISVGVLDAFLLQRRQISAPIVRLLGWTASFVGLTALTSFLIPSWSPGPFIGAGGYLGALTRTVLEQHFALLGSLILCTSLLVGGLLLSTDYTLFRVAAKVKDTSFHYGQMAARKLPLNKTRSDSKNSESKADDGEYEDADDDGEQLSVRIRGKRLTPLVTETDVDDEDLENELENEDDDADGQDDEDDAEYEEDDEELTDEDEEPETPVRKMQREEAPAPLLRNRRASDERERVMHSLDEASRQADAEEYELPSADLLIPGDTVSYESQAQEVRRKAKILERTFADFGFQVKVVEIETGPVIAQYEVQLEAGLRLSRITGLADDLAIALRVPSVRIVAPIPGKNTVGIEVPNAERQVVRLREVFEESTPKMHKMRVPLFLGKDVSGNPLTVDLSTLPHLLIAGRTGTGKSVCLNAIICSILMTRRPDEVRLLLIDPKMVELSCYGRLPHLMHPVVTDMRKAEAILAWAVDKMEERYALLARAGVRHISSYNQLSEEELVERLQPTSDDERRNIPLQLPFIVIVADEMADLMMTAGKEVEQHIIRLAQKSRAVGIHLILATQKPTVDVITGLIKSNLPARISFQVASRTDSRVVLDEMGADKLLGNGDMLFLWPGTSTLLRGQGTYLSDDEIEKVVDFVSTGEQNFVNELVNIKVTDSGDADPERFRKRDELYEQAIDIIVREGRGSVSLLQRALGIGYGRAARLIDFMEEDGIVGTYAGSQAREVLITYDDWERMQKGGAAAPASPPALPAPTSSPPPRWSNRIRPADEESWDHETPAPGSSVATRRRITLADPEEEEAYEDEELYDEEVTEEDEETSDELEDFDEDAEQEECGSEEDEAYEEDEEYEEVDEDCELEEEYEYEEEDEYEQDVDEDESEDLNEVEDEEAFEEEEAGEDSQMEDADVPFDEDEANLDGQQQVELEDDEDVENEQLDEERRQQAMRMRLRRNRNRRRYA